MNEKVKAIIELTRLNKPAGFILLLWPCLWALTLTKQTIPALIYINFIIGSILMRAAGCVLNDIFDIDFDKNVTRTRNRPLVANKLKIVEALVIMAILCIASLIMSLLILPVKTVIIASIWLILVAIYPLAKRYTYFPQYVLGITFNGVIIAYSVVKDVDIKSITLYIATVFWICGYDTIYAISDYKDDIKIGVKSPVVLFKDQTIYFIALNYLIFIMLLIVTHYNHLIILPAAHLCLQIYWIYKKRNYQQIFKSNIITGFLVLLALRG